MYQRYFRTFRPMTEHSKDIDVGKVMLKDANYAHNANNSH